MVALAYFIGSYLKVFISDKTSTQSNSSNERNLHVPIIGNIQLTSGMDGFRGSKDFTHTHLSFHL